MATTPLVESHGFTVHPATHARFDDVRTMIGPKNPTSSVCWCLSHRIPARDNQSLVGPERAAFVEALTRKRIKPGVLAYDGEKVDLTMAYVGTRKLFEDAGFELAARTEATSAGFPRVIMRATPSRWLAR